MAKLKSINNKTPDLEIKIHLVEYGYQIEVFEDGKPKFGQCRDFLEDYTIRYLKDRIISTLLQNLQSL